MAQRDEPHRQLRDRVAERVRTDIFEGRLLPGMWLRQEQLAQQYGVSQMPVREALKLLAAEGLVEYLPYRGVRVTVLTRDDVSDLYAHRAFLEGRAAALAAQQISPDELTAVRALHEQMCARMAPEQLVEYRALNRRFHETIFRASRRAYLIRTLTQLWDAFPTMLWANFSHTVATPLPVRDSNDVGEHAAIIEALAQGDARAAEARTREHIEAAGLHLVATLPLHRPPTTQP
jgi:DNA-binding GntR family transcriptional regulator